MDSEHGIKQQDEQRHESTEPDDKPEVSLPQLATTSPSRPVKKNLLRRLSRRQALTLVAVVVTVSSGAGGYMLMRGKKSDVPAVSQQQTSQTLAPTTKANEAKTLPDVGATEQELALQRFAHPTTGETWLSEWKPLPDQKLWKDIENVKYYDVGNRKDNRIIISSYAEMMEVLYLFEVSPNGEVRMIVKPDPDTDLDSSNLDWLKDAVAVKVKLDDTTHYDSLTLPRSLSLQNGHVLKKSAYTGLGARLQEVEGQTVSDLQSFGDSTVQLLERSDSSTNLTSIGYGVVLPLHTRVMMEFQPLETDLKDYTWTQGVPRVEDSIAAISRGCGGLTASVTRADTLADEDTEQVGLTPSGLRIYALKSLDHPLMQKAYQEHKEFYGDTPSDWNKYPGISQEDFARQHAVVLYHDPTGQWLIYARNDLRPQGGCAKPVVYLYPQHRQQVSVNVGAHITVSDPFYDPLRGWNVMAYPGGSLLVGGRLYGSLFWEGPGIGEYPNITAGTVVRTADAPATMRTQLAAQGLNEREASDFMDYWQPKLPYDKPYVRLTWFNTLQMNRLAPLAVHPNPDTMIRVFLDFEGLEAPASLPGQQLQATPRHGFTLVEWGGLAHEPLSQ